MSDDLVMDLLKRVSELERRLNDTVIYGVVSAVQYNPYRVQVNYGTPDKPQHTALLSVVTARAAGAKTWWPLEVGEAVMVISPNGNTKLGRVYPATYSDAELQPDDDPDRCWIEFGQGNRCYIERDTGKLYLKLNSHIEIEAPDSITINSDVIECSGDIIDHHNTNEFSMERMRNTYDSHIHTGDNGGNTSTPHQNMS